MPYAISEFARQKVRAYAEAHMDGLVTIVRGGRGAMDPTTGRVAGVAVTAVVYGSTTLAAPGTQLAPPPPSPVQQRAPVTVSFPTDEPAPDSGPVVTPAAFPTPVEQAEADTGGKARFHTVTGQGAISNGVGEYDMRQVIVSIPWSAALPRQDDIILVRDAGVDDTLNEATLRVVEVEGGSAFGDARRLSCTLQGYSEYWTGVGTP